MTQPLVRTYVLNLTVVGEILLDSGTYNAESCFFHSHIYCPCVRVHVWCVCLGMHGCKFSLNMYVTSDS